jgi:hypothetical protein
MNFFTNFLFIVTMVAMFDEGMGSSILILKDYYIYMYMYVLNLISMFSLSRSTYTAIFSSPVWAIAITWHPSSVCKL